MPIHLIWGDDAAASTRAIENLIKDIVHPAWTSINLSRLDGSDSEQTSKALTEMRTPPFGEGGRVVVIKRSPLCNNCPSELAKSFEEVLELIPEQTHLILNNSNKPDKRLKSTKALLKLVKTSQATEKSFLLPAFWDEAGQEELVKRTAKELDLELSQEVISYLVKAIGNNTDRLHSELQKLALHAGTSPLKLQPQQKKTLININTVHALIEGLATNAFQIGEALLANDIGGAIVRLDALIDSGEPALRILATLSGQVRGWLWVSLLDSQGEKDVGKIAKAAGIANPKRIYVMRKQLQGRPPQQFLDLLSCLLDIEAAIKRGTLPRDAFRDGLLSKNYSY